MLDLHITIDGDKVLIDGLQELAGTGIPRAIDRGLNRVAAGVHSEAQAWLSGPGSKASRKKGVEGSAAGSYPVPVVSSNLRHLLAWLRPGASKTGPAGTFTAGPNEVVIYDSAEYADPVFHGKGSSAKFGERDALKDGLERFNQGNRIAGILEEEIQKEIKK